MSNNRGVSSTRQASVSLPAHSQHIAFNKIGKRNNLIYKTMLVCPEGYAGIDSLTSAGPRTTLKMHRKFTDGHSFISLLKNLFLEQINNNIEPRMHLCVYKWSI